MKTGISNATPSLGASVISCLCPCPSFFFPRCTFLPSVLSAFRGPRPGYPTGPGAFWCIGAASWNSGSEGKTGDSWSHSTPTRFRIDGVVPRHPYLILSQLHDQHHSQLCAGRLDLVSWFTVYCWVSWDGRFLLYCFCLKTNVSKSGYF